MNSQSIAPTPLETQVASGATASYHIERAAFHLYASVMPVDGLAWTHLSIGQRNDYRRLILAARDVTDRARESR